MKLGCIADDFSGATDLCSVLVRAGLRTLLVTPLASGSVANDPGYASDFDAVVIALKSRTVGPAEAVDWSLVALSFLERAGAETYLFKYCSTFDSTDEGNIGPVLDALLTKLGESSTIVCPAYPSQGRTVYQGHLFVGDRLLSESAMAEHPLNPMRQSSILQLLARQTARGVGLIAYDVVDRGASAITQDFVRATGDGTSYVIVDALNDRHLASIATAFRGLRLISGAAGIGAAVGLGFGRGAVPGAKRGPLPSAGPTLVLVGSSSPATRAQVARVEGRLPCLQVDPVALHRGETRLEDVLIWTRAHIKDVGVLVSTSATPERLRRVQAELGQPLASKVLEDALASIALAAVSAGVRRLVVAGGETSAAVVQALGVTSLEVLEELEPGVPWMRSIGAPSLTVALKSGNFGSDAFIERAVGL